MDATNVAVIPTQANRIRALKAAEPQLLDGQIALRLGVHLRLVQITLAGGDKRRLKSVAR
jgi:hypothetical protein